MANQKAIDWAKILDEKLDGVTLANLPPTLELPALPIAVTQYMERSKDPDVSLKDLAKIIKTDSGLTLGLLRHLNSSFVGLRHKATSVLQGLSLLGKRQSTMFLITTGMEAAVRSHKSKLLHQESFWVASLQKALFAREVAKLLKADEDIAFAGGMLSDFLLPVLTNDLYESYLEFVENRENHPEMLIQYESKKFGWDHAIAAASLARRWFLPDELVGCILMHHRGLHMLADPVLMRSSATAVAIAALLPDQLRQNFTGLEQLILLQEKWPAFDFEDLIYRVDKFQDEASSGVKNEFPLARRCLPVIERFKEKREGKEEQEVASS
ncbi:MAG: HDOD domain-containing protein [Planctomycetaceae bacterium]|nr:HDOD domain-containing protein [Planctomycetaceae bacterium]